MDSDPFDCGIIAAILKLKEIGFIKEELDFLISNQRKYK